ncbi:MAG: hypothetical protein WCK39_00960 [Methanomassiliicoccales archaeon]
MDRQARHKLVWYENNEAPALVAWGNHYRYDGGILFFQGMDREIVLSPQVKYVVK